MQPMFKLLSTETKTLTPELAQAFKAMPPSPTERQFDPVRAKLLREKVEAGQAITFNWAIAKVDEKEYRVNGNHSSTMLSDLNGQFPEGLKVHIDTYKVDSTAGLALLFRQFDYRKGGRTPTDVSGAYQGLYTDLAGVLRGDAKLAVEGVAWFDRHIEGLPAPKGDDIYTLFGKTDLHNFIKWIGEVFSIKTPELRKQTIVAAMYGSFEKNEAEARKFWREVSRGGVEFEDNHPTTVLDTFLKSALEDKRKIDLKSPSFYQASIYAWNAFRENKTITSVKYDAKKGFYTVAA
jgi:hypothetical protein